MWFISYYLRSDNGLSEVQIGSCTLSKYMEYRVRMTFGFSLYTTTNRNTLVVYFRKDNQVMLMNEFTRR